MRQCLILVLFLFLFFCTGTWYYFYNKNLRKAVIDKKKSRRPLMLVCNTVLCCWFELLTALSAVHAGLWFLFSSSLISWTSSYLGQTSCPSENLWFYFTKRMRGVIYERPDPVLFFLFCFSFDEWEVLGKDFFSLSSYFFYHSLLISMWYWPLHLKCFCPVVWLEQSRWMVSSCVTGQRRECFCFMSPHLSLPAVSFLGFGYVSVRRRKSTL